MANKAISPQTVQFVTQNGCASCGVTINVNKGIPLQCKEWSNEDSALLRERMLVDNQLFASGLVRRVEASSLGNSLRIKKVGIDVGPIRTQDSGAPKENECRVKFDGITMKEFEKTFYVVNTSKDLQICTKDFIGKSWQDLIGQRISDYEADAFAQSDLGDAIIAAIIDEYSAFLPEFLLMAACGSPIDRRHGDDGILAKAYYAAMNQYFHTISYDFADDVVAYFSSKYINAIVGGAHYDTNPSTFATPQLYLLDFVSWLNGHELNGVSLLTATYDITTSVVTVVSNMVTKDIDLRIVVNDGETVDWVCKDAIENEKVYTLYQNSMMINDVPLLFNYETINSTNFAQLFSQYKTDYFTYLLNNGFEDIEVGDVFIAIDPLLMFQRAAQTQGEFISGNPNADFMAAIGLEESQFIRLNALKGSGLFFMTTKGNLLMLDDGSNVLDTLSNMGRIAIEKCNSDAPGMVNIFGSVPPIGSSVEAWGLFASNLLGSKFVLENKLADREPCDSAKLQIVCYDGDVKNHCLVQSTCELSTRVSSEIAYDELLDQTTITVSMETFGVDGVVSYNFNWALSDGTGEASINTPNFIIVLPGNQTAAGLRLTITGSASYLEGASICTGYIVYENQFGSGDGITYCTGTITNDQVANAVTSGLSLSYDIDGTTETVAFVNPLLDLNLIGDYPAIESEIETILNGTNATLSLALAVVTFSMTNIPSFISNIVLSSTGSGNSTTALVMDCNG